MRGFSLWALVLMLACSQPQGMEQKTTDKEMEEDTTKTIDEEMTFLALGDSYTIGERVLEEERWPVRLVERFNAQNEQKLAPPTIIARTGWTTNELLTGISNADVKPPYDLVSLLIGVNNQYRGYPVDQYREEFSDLLQQAISFAGDDPQHVFVVSIPDYGVTPFAEEQNLNKEKIAEEIDLYNKLAKEIAGQHQVEYFDITPISRKAAEDPDLLASDRLHPSGAMYTQWVELMLPWVLQILDE